MVWAYGLGIAQITEMTHEITEMFDLKYWNSYAQVGDTALGSSAIYQEKNYSHLNPHGGGGGGGGGLITFKPRNVCLLGIYLKSFSWTRMLQNHFEKLKLYNGYSLYYYWTWIVASVLKVIFFTEWKWRMKYSRTPVIWASITLY